MNGVGESIRQKYDHFISKTIFKEGAGKAWDTIRGAAPSPIQFASDTKSEHEAAWKSMAD